MRIPFYTVSAEYLGFFVAFITNVTLIYLIITRTRQNFGSYKYLMLWFAAFSLWYSIIDILTQPAMHSYLNSFIVFCASWFKYDPLLASIIIPTYCTSYGLTLVLLAIHFVYRYIAMIHPNEIRWFKYPRALIVGSQGEIQIQWKSCLAMTNVYCIAITTLVTIMSLGYSIYIKMQSVNDMVAEKTRALQRQLFHALVLQTIVPIIFMYTPTTILFLCPIIGVELGMIANMTSVCLALYPALDPLVVMYFIKDYRSYLLKKMNISKKVSTVTGATSVFRNEDEII
ncbi:Seven TM Receptor [Caenorhabditis elegans]|uniref:Seven TM Receptor n=1 Tax=Caenorhabditis elegans TaxID=6239 RepID=Q9GS14_CAEEL|nr:Seven TM Receptor [Caenorhabditis elegans]CCD68935.1 Seven TM Receptor [Caenorhabditis elegans]|eukprot:NP_505395.2 Seven TM Receptor [Caenorhabditis elegans]